MAPGSLYLTTWTGLIWSVEVLPCNPLVLCSLPQLPQPHHLRDSCSLQPNSRSPSSRGKAGTYILYMLQAFSQPDILHLGQERESDFYTGHLNMPHSFPDNRLYVYVFGDQTYDVADTLLSLTQTREDTLLLDFLSRSCDVLQREVSRLPAHQREKCPPFTSLVDLVLLYRRGTLNTAFVQALTCIAQLGLFLGRVSKGCQEYPSERNSVSVGICTGALAAAAVSSAHSASSLISPVRTRRPHLLEEIFLTSDAQALEAISVAVRLGALAWDAADRISHGQLEKKDEDAFPSWSWVTTGSTVDVMENALEQYALQTGLPSTAVPYVAATGGPTQSVVSGPPNIVPQFLASTIGKSVAKTSMPIRITAPYHSGTLYSKEDLSRVLHSNSTEESSIPLRLPVLSACSEGQYPDGRKTLIDALEMAVQDCMTRRLALDTLPGRIAQHVQDITAKLAHHRDGSQSLAVEIQPVLFQGADRLGVVVAQSIDRDAVSDASVSNKCSVTVRERWPLSVDNTKSDPPYRLHSTADSRLAILSASGRFPGRADTMDAFWKILLGGIDTHEMVPPERWNASAHVGNTSAKNVSGTGFGCWLHQAAQFDAAYFNMSPREAAQVDPAQRLALLAATEALEQAGIVPNRTPSTHKKRVGVWFGCTSNDWMETNSAQNIDTYFIPGGNRAFIPGRINYHFKFSGPSFTIDTACSSSLAALHMACNALWRGEVDTAIVGGTNVLTNPDMTAGLDRGHFLSRTGNCKTFDDGADGYCRGEAVVTIILKRLDDAVADKDPIQACIPPRGVATNHNAEAESITRPHAAAQKELFEHVLNATGVRASDISYVEMHGTGTQAGDFGETTSVVTTLSPVDPLGYCLRPDDQPLHIGAVKSNVGHGEAAAGVTSLAKVLLMFKHHTIPPHIGVKTKLNHRLPDLRAHNTRIATAATPWNKPQNGIRRVLLNNFSAAGGNTAIILEDPSRDGLHSIPRLISDPDPRRFHIVTISGKTSEALLANLRNTVAWIDSTASTSSAVNVLAKLSYTTTARRMHHRYRVAVTATDLGHAKALLQKQVDRRSNGEKSNPMPAKAPRFVFCFTGQGSPYAGMGADLFARFASFRADVRRYDHTCVQLGLPPILSFFETDKGAGSLDGISPVVLQLSHVCFQMALFRLWKSFGIEPATVVGHSLGEYAALYAAGALTQTSVIHLVGRRAQLMDKYLDAGAYTMLVAMVGEDKIESTLAGHNVTYEISCRNGKNNTVIGGTTAQISAAKTVLEASGIMCHALDSPFAFHTSQADPILGQLLRVSEACPIQPLTIPVISPTQGKVLHSPEDFGEDYFVKHCRHPVNMLQALTSASSEGLIDAKTVGIEIGPAPVVTRMAKEVVGPSMHTFASVHKAMDTWQVLCDALVGIYTLGSSMNWDQYHNDFSMCHEVLQLPAYGWTLKDYWLQYVHDWSLRKGDPPLVLTSNLAFSEIYKVEKNSISAAAGGEVIIDLDLNHVGVHDMAQGHKVYGVPLCTPSVYADIAMMIGNYTKQILGLDKDKIATEIADMHIMAALVANDAGNKQTLRTSAKLDRDAKSLSCSFLSVDSNGKETQLHATCSVRFAELNAIKTQLQEAAFTARERIHSLADKSREPGGNTYRFSTAMIYKMVGQLADFAPKYRGLSAITLDNDALEAAGTISFRSTASDGDSLWFMNPAYLDAFSQLGGFVMNANEKVDLDKELFVNHGWASMRLFRSQLDPRATYHSYVKMNQGKDNLWSGDVLIFDEQYELIGVIGGVALQGVQKRLMEYIIKSANKKVSGGVSTSQSSDRAPITVEMKNPPVKPVVKVAIQPDPAVVIVKPQKVSVTIGSDPWQTVLDILSEESGVDRSELGDDVGLADIGIDSLLSLVVCGRLRDDLDVDLPDGALFQDCFSVGDIKKHVPGAGGIAMSGNPTPPTSEQDSSDGHDISQEDTISVSSDSDATNSDFAVSPSDSTSYETPLTPSVFFKDDKFSPQVTTVELSPDEEPIKPAWSLYLQGSRKRSSSTLFLFPDGCGAATSYMDLPPISPSLALVGFNSPFMKTPHLMYEHTLSQVLHSYLAGIRARQPHGPYHLGGWSAGGIIAYALAAQLLAEGEAVASLTLIDSPPPDRGLDHLPERFFAHCTRVGVFGTEMARGQNEAVGRDGKDHKAPTPPEWLLPHFRATIDLLHDYHAPPLSARNSAVLDMKVSIIWAQECALDGVRYPKLPPRESGQVDDEEGVKFLSEPRVDFGPGRWAGLFPPGVSISTHTVEGEHHFSMMRGPGAARLAKLVKEATGSMA